MAHSCGDHQQKCSTTLCLSFCRRSHMAHSPSVMFSLLWCLGSCPCAHMAHSPAVMFSLLWCLGSCPCVPVAYSCGDHQQKYSTTFMPKFLPAQPRSPLTSSNVLTTVMPRLLPMPAHGPLLRWSPAAMFSLLWWCLGSCQCSHVAHSPAVMFSQLLCLGSCPCPPMAHSWGDHQQQCSHYYDA